MTLLSRTYIGCLCVYSFCSCYLINRIPHYSYGVRLGVWNVVLLRFRKRYRLDSNFRLYKDRDKRTKKCLGSGTRS